MHAALTTDYLLQKEEIAKLQEAASVSHTPSFHIAPTEPQQPVLHTETTSKVPIQSPKSQKTSPKTSASPINKAFKFKKHQSPEQIRPSDKHLSKDNVDAYRHYELEVEELNRRCGDLQRELNKANKELGRQEEMRRKKEEQVAGLVDTLKQRDLEISRLTKDVRRKEETVKSMTVEMQLVAGKVERDTKAKIQKEMESMRHLAITKEEETRRTRHFLRSHNQGINFRHNHGSSKQSSRSTCAQHGAEGTDSLNSTMPATPASHPSDFPVLPTLQEQALEESLSLK